MTREVRETVLKSQSVREFSPWLLAPMALVGWAVRLAAEFELNWQALWAESRGFGQGEAR